MKSAARKMTRSPKHFSGITALKRDSLKKARLKVTPNPVDERMWTYRVVGEVHIRPARNKFTGKNV